MTTAIHDLMSAPPVTCETGTSLKTAARRMAEAGIGAVLVTDRSRVAGILTERDLLRAAAAGVDPVTAIAGTWMTPQPDVLDPDDDAGVAWDRFTHSHYRHLPVVDGGRPLGVVSSRDLMGTAPRGLEGLVVADTSVGDVRGEEGFYLAFRMSRHRFHDVTP